MTNDELLSKVRYAPRKIDHHGKYAGYDILFDRMKLKKACSPFFSRLADLLPEFIAWRLRQMRPQESGKQGLKAEIAALPWVMGGKGRVCHFIYGEDTYFFTPLWKTKKNKIIATFHYPPSRLCQRVSPGAVKSLDAVVLVGSNQKEYFQEILPESKIFVIPHHVDADYFVPIDSSFNNEVRAVFVGNCMRDFETLFLVFKAIEKSNLKLRCDLVIPREKHSLFAMFDFVICHSGLADHELLHLYQKSEMGLMIMTDCTANNSVLEMMSCGLPVITTDVGGIRDYIDPEGGMFSGVGQVDSLVSQIKELIEKPDLRKQMGEANRERIIGNFSVSVVAKRMLDFYTLLLEE